MRTPKLLLEQEASMTVDQAKILLRYYSHAFVRRYRGKFLWWDVINELISDYSNNRPFHVQNSLRYRKLCMDYVTYAFQFAHKSDSNSQLYYNEYCIEAGG
ncbi:unnamed protein product [Adineta ricciae]|uniref:GH10 domain-containing protein n=1 Tax=Adineta ricciae TaxID=249248 RepID=A0A814Y8Q2_ADIRI|nr:unnamed protein product [Adineta ricciae]